MDSREFVETLKNEITTIKQIKAFAKCGFVVCNEKYVQVEKYDLNGTGLAVRSPLICSDIKIYEDLKTAENNINLYLVDGKNNPIILEIKSIHDFLQEEINKYTNLLKRF